MKGWTGLWREASVTQLRRADFREPSGAGVALSGDITFTRAVWKTLISECLRVAHLSVSRWREDVSSAWSGLAFRLVWSRSVAWGWPKAVTPPSPTPPPYQLPASNRQLWTDSKLWLQGGWGWGSATPEYIWNIKGVCRGCPGASVWNIKFLNKGGQVESGPAGGLWADAYAEKADTMCSGTRTERDLSTAPPAAHPRIILLGRLTSPSQTPPWKTDPSWRTPKVQKRTIEGEKMLAIFFSVLTHIWWMRWFNWRRKLKKSNN